MNSRVLIVLAAAAAVGVPLGLLTAGRQGETPPADPPTTPTPADGPPAPHRIPLSPADAKAVHERPAVAVDARGRLLLAWAAETAPNVRTLFLARSADGGRTLTPPAPFRPVGVFQFVAKMKGREVTRSSNVLPRLASAGDTLVLGWTEHVGNGTVEFRVARSTDGGETFTEPVRAHGPAAVRPGFTALAAGADGSVVCSWLDNRNGSQQPFAAVWPAGSPAFEPESLVYAGPTGAGVCPCCDTEAAFAPDGSVLVAFRNNAENIRDMHVARRAPGATAFEPPVAVGSHNWQFNGCPHDGPSVAFAGGRRAVAWMDAHAGRPRVFFERDGRSAPLDPTAVGTQGHPRLAAAGENVLAVWDASLGDDPAPAAAPDHAGHAPAPTGAGRAIVWTTLAADGAPPAARPVAPVSGAFQLNPAVAVAPDGTAVAAWNELTDGGKAVVLVRIPRGR